MWVFTSKGFISAVAHRNKPGYLMVRARKQDHLADIFPGVEISQVSSSDYKYRVTIHKDHFSATIDKLVQVLDYDNFKGSIPDHEYHDACTQVWKVMHAIQPGSHMPKHHPELFDDPADPGEPFGDEPDEDPWLNDVPVQYQVQRRPAPTSIHCPDCGVELLDGDDCPDCNFPV